MTGRPTGSTATVVAEVALAAVTLVAIASLLRVFDHGSWMWVLFAQAIAAHISMAVTRRRGWRLAGSAAVTVALGAVVITSIYAGGSLTGVGREVGDSFAVFGDIKAPVPAENGFLIACAASVWLIGVLSDWWAFRLRATVEAAIPAGALFAFATILGADRHRAVHAGLFIAAVLVHVLATRTRTAASQDHWIGSVGPPGPAMFMRLGAALVVVAVAFAVVVGPNLPSATADGAVDLRNLDGDSPEPRVTVSPLVNIQKQLVQQADVVVFTVRSDVDAYWRLTSLDQFDGRIWASNGSFGDGTGDLDDGVPVDAERTVIEQRFRIQALRQLWVPAAYEPQSVESEDEIRYDESSGTLIVGHDMKTSDGLTYEVTSALPILDPAALTAASTAIPDDIADTYLALPDDFPTKIADLARSVTADGASTYEKALLLQSFFRSEFEYSLDVDDSHSNTAMMSFLFDSRTGYCEQFAGTYAAMARSLGIPARVAVGFTPGERTATNPDVLTVRGVNAHAWPEIYLGEYGWVAFEPTPGRGAPGAEAYTGVPEQQAQPVDTPDTTVAPPTSAAPSQVTTPSTTTVGQETPQPTDDIEDASPANPWPRRTALVVVALVAVLALYVLVVWAFDLIRARRRRSRAHSEHARIATAWDEALQAVRDVGVATPGDQTQNETARQVDERLPEATGPFHDLADMVERSTFSPRAPDEGDGSRAYEFADAVRGHATAAQDVLARLRRKYDPRVRLRG